MFYMKIIWMDILENELMMEKTVLGAELSSFDADTHALLVHK